MTMITHNVTHGELALVHNEDNDKDITAKGLPGKYDESSSRGMLNTLQDRRRR